MIDIMIDYFGIGIDPPSGIATKMGLVVDLGNSSRRNLPFLLRSRVFSELSFCIINSFGLANASFRDANHIEQEKASSPPVIDCDGADPELLLGHRLEIPSEILGSK